MVAEGINIDIKVALKNLKECQANNEVSSCVLCQRSAHCQQKAEFEEAVLADLDSKRVALQECQEARKFSSCLACEEVLKCEVRDDYVNSVYLSMNKGNGGSFEF